MKNILMLLVFVGAGICAYAQAGSDTSLRPSPSGDIRERLVKLALQNPDLEVTDHQIKIAEYELKQAKSAWLNHISVSGNMNEFTLKSRSNSLTPSGHFYPYYPIYNVAVTLPLGGFFNKSAKIAREQLAVEEATRDSRSREIRATVLSKYEDYTTFKQLLTVQSQITESAYTNYLQAKDKFANGEVSIDDYNKAIEQYHDQLLQQINMRHDLQISKIDLEKLIAAKLEDVIGTATDQSSVSSSQ